MLGVSVLKKVALATLLASSALGLVAVVLIIVSGALRRAAVLETRVSLMQHVMMVLVLYDGDRHGLPKSVYTDDAGRVLGSWRFATLRFGAWQNWREEVNADMKAPWNAPANRGIASKRYLYCFDDSRGEERFHTNVFAVTGPGTAFDPDQKRRLEELPRNLIVLVEVAHSGVHWMAPGDLRIDQIPESLTEGLDGEGFHVAFPDQSVWYLRKDVPIDDVKKFFTIDSARKYDRRKVLGKYLLRVCPP